MPVFAMGGDPSRLTAPVVVVQLAAGGTGSLSEWRSAVGALLARLDAAGKLQSTRYILQVPGAGLGYVGVGIVFFALLFVLVIRYHNHRSK